MIDIEYILLLRHLHKIGFKSTIIAGGYIRDLFFKNEYKDVDIFLWHPRYSDEKILSYSGVIYQDFDINEEFLLDYVVEPNEKLGSPLQTLPSKKMEYLYTISGIVDVWNVYHFDKDKQIQFIFVDEEPIDYIAYSFDIGLCMCYFDGKKIRYTNNFMKDYINKTITICGELSQEELDYTFKSFKKKISQLYCASSSTS